MKRPNTSIKDGDNHTSALEYGAMREILHIRLLPFRAQQAVSYPVSGVA